MQLRNKRHGVSMDTGLAFMRVGFGSILVFVHGWQKLADAGGFLFSGHAWGFVGLVRSLGFPIPAFFAICAALGESVGALCVACGFLTRISAAMVTITMIVAAYTSARTGTSVELAGLYAILFVAIGIMGPGRFSVDSLLSRSQPVARVPFKKRIT
jgi:putative oxidoreductase